MRDKKIHKGWSSPILAALSLTLLLSACVTPSTPKSSKKNSKKTTETSRKSSAVKKNPTPIVFKYRILDKDKAGFYHGNHYFEFSSASSFANCDGVVVALPKKPGKIDTPEQAFDKFETNNIIAPLLSDKVSSQKITTILLDPGHGGTDKGAISRRKYLEKELNLKLAKAIGEALRARGFKVCYTREDDTFIPLPKRGPQATACKAQIFVSIHHNAAGKETACGYEIFVSPPSEEANFKESLSLAWQIQKQVTSLESGMDRGVRFNDLKVLVTSPVPAVLVEAGFLTNSHDESNAISESKRKEFAEKLAAGIANFASKKVTGKSAKTTTKSSNTAVKSTSTTAKSSNTAVKSTSTTAKSTKKSVKNSKRKGGK